MKRRIVIESPYAGDVEHNLSYLRACMRDSLMRGEAPFASHGLYTQPGVLDDTVPEERALGMEAGFEWAVRAEAVAVYMDLGLSPGMRVGVERAAKVGLPLIYRTLGHPWKRS